MNRETTDKRMLEAQEVDNNKIRKALFVSMSIRYVTGTCYLVNIPKVQVCRSSVVSKSSYKMIRHVTFGYLIS